MDCRQSDGGHAFSYDRAAAGARDRDRYFGSRGGGGARGGGDYALPFRQAGRVSDGERLGIRDRRGQRWLRIFITARGNPCWACRRGSRAALGRTARTETEG